MKLLTFITIVVSSLQVSIASDSITEEFLKIEPTQASEFLARSSSYGYYSELASEAIKFRRLDLIEICFNRSGMAGFVLEEIAELADSEYKDQLIVLVLRVDSPYWPNNEPFVDGSRVGAHVYMQEPVSGVVRKYFPERLSNLTLLEGRKNRLALASDIEQAIRGKNLHKLELREEAGVQEQAKIPKLASTPQKPELVASKAPEQKLCFFQSGYTRLVAWVSVILVTIGGFRWVLKRRK